jgi:GDP-D-mannose dehydratase
MKALITGITGQDGAYLAYYLLNKGYEVYGTYPALNAKLLAITIFGYIREDKLDPRGSS